MSMQANRCWWILLVNLIINTQTAQPGKWISKYLVVLQHSHSRRQRSSQPDFSLFNFWLNCLTPADRCFRLPQNESGFRFFCRTELKVVYEISSRFENQFGVICQDQWLYSLESCKENSLLMNGDKENLIE